MHFSIPFSIPSDSTLRHWSFTGQSSTWQTQLDLSLPDLAQKVTDHQPKSLPRNNKPVRSFSVGEKVGSRSPHVKWIPGTITKVTGPVSYLIELADGLVRCHVDAVRKRTSDIVDDSSSTSDSASDFLFDLMFLQPSPTLQLQLILLPPP